MGFLNMPIFTFAYSSSNSVWRKEVTKHKLYTAFQLSPDSLSLFIWKGQGLLHIYNSSGKSKKDNKDIPHWILCHRHLNQMLMRYPKRQKTSEGLSGMYGLGCKRWPQELQCMRWVGVKQLTPQRAILPNNTNSPKVLFHFSNSLPCRICILKLYNRTPFNNI